VAASVFPAGDAWQAATPSHSVLELDWNRPTVLLLALKAAGVRPDLTWLAAATTSQIPTAAPSKSLNVVRWRPPPLPIGALAPANKERSRL